MGGEIEAAKAGAEMVQGWEKAGLGASRRMHRR